MGCNHEQQRTPGFWRSRTGIGFIVIGAVAGYFLVTEHWDHVVSVLPYLLLLVCPLMHLFMHGGHGGQNGGHADSGKMIHRGCCSHHAKDQNADRESPSSEKREIPTDKGD